MEREAAAGAHDDHLAQARAQILELLARHAVERDLVSRSELRKQPRPRGAVHGMSARSLVAPFAVGPFPELDELQRLIDGAGPAARVTPLGEVAAGGRHLPLLAVELGSARADAPAIGFFGGVHGVERIGAQVVLAFLHTLVERLRWDDSLAQLLEGVRLVFLPLVNPGGMLLGTRANPAGVDLMRNAPVDAEGPVAPLLGGQRLTPLLPWYRGPAGAPLQPEADALCRVVESRLISQPFSLAVDCHSGFGVRNHIWFPYAHTRRPIECLPELFALRNLFRATHPHHILYVIEPQARRYTTHGDLWDHLYDRSRQNPGRLFLPITLEMGSWLWVRKNPTQLFGRLGLFNPIEPHRVRRILRQHVVLFDFLIRAARSHARWRPSDEEREPLRRVALEYWRSR